MLLKIIT